MYYKVIFNNHVVDVLDQVVYLKYNPRHKIMVTCAESEAQAIMSSDKNTIWHEATLYDIPISGYDTVLLLEIDRYEYDRLRILHCMTPEEIIDNYTMSLINEGVIK